MKSSDFGRATDLLDAVARGPSGELESEVVEFKEYRDGDAIYNSNLAEEISALANRAGGMLVIGIKDSKHVTNADWPAQLVGAPNIDPVELKERLLGKLRPRIDLEVHRVNYSGRSFLSICVPFRRDVLVGTAGGKYYVREGRSSRPMAPEEITASVKAQTSYDWSADVLDLDVTKSLDRVAIEAALREFRERRSLPQRLPVVNFLEAVGVTRNGILTRGGLLFLGTAGAIREHIGDVEYRFSWRMPNGRLRVNDVWNGCTWAAITRAKAHFDRCNSTYEFAYRGRTHSARVLDPSAFHEAYMNALVHRDYTADGMVAINFTGDQLRITSPGSFYGGVTPDNIGKHEPRHRNKALAAALMKYNFVDRAGMGVARMNIKSLMYGRKLPVFTESLGSVSVLMEAHYVREPVFLIAAENEDRFGFAELLLLNRLCDVGIASVADLLGELERVTDDPWRQLENAVKRLDGAQLAGSADGLLVRVDPDHLATFRVDHPIKEDPSSGAHLKLFSFLRKQTIASTGELRSALGHRTATQTTRFLHAAKYVERVGSARATRWRLREPAHQSSLRLDVSHSYTPGESYSTLPDSR